MRYCGEYYDDESGLTYMRGRYYSSELRRFITEDPAKDGVNWYSYCGNNPIMYVDPWGLAISPDKTNSKEDNDLLIEDMMRITNDELYIDEKNKIQYTPVDDNSITKPAGTLLIRKLIEDKSSYIIKVDRTRENQKIGDTVYYNPDYDSQTRVLLSDGTTKELSRPSYIGLAHELIHFANEGTSRNSSWSLQKISYYFSYDDQGYGILENWYGRELKTIGIVYFDYEAMENHYLLTNINYNFVKINGVRITENDIRKENGLPIRVKY